MTGDALTILLAAAVLEAGDDALIRSGLPLSASSTRYFLWLVGALLSIGGPFVVLGGLVMSPGASR